jgi:MarR family transcriptional regulator, organic hydroperoxide resistance regulator
MPASKRPARKAPAKPIESPQAMGNAAPTADDATAAAVRALRQFRLIFNTVKTHFQQVEKKAGVGGAQVWALSVIQEQPGIGVTDLARHMDIHQTTASNLVRSLVEAGLVLAERKGADRRAVQLRMQEAGVRVLRKAPGPSAGVLPDALAQLDNDTLLRLEADLAALLNLLDADARGASIPLAHL